MRTTALALGLTLGLAGPCLAQSNRGAYAVDAMIAPTTGLGFAYYVTDGLSLRPWLGLGYSDYQGFFANVGAQLRYEFGTGWTVSPYLSASAQYSHSEASGIVTPGPVRLRRAARRLRSTAAVASSEPVPDCASASRAACRSSPKDACCTRRIRSASSSVAGARSTSTTAPVARSCSACRIYSVSGRSAAGGEGFSSSAWICCRSASVRPGEKRLSRGDDVRVPK